MKSKNVYSYDGETGEYRGIVVAFESPLEKGKYLLPANSTELEPPEAGENEVAVWDGKKWVISEDWRGRNGFVDGEPVEIEDIGPLPEGWSDTPPEPTEDQKKQQRKAEILAELDELDRKSERPTQAIILAQTQGKQPSKEDVDYLADYQVAKDKLREELDQLL